MTLKEQIEKRLNALVGKRIETRPLWDVRTAIGDLLDDYAKANGLAKPLHVTAGENVLGNSLSITYRHNYLFAIECKYSLDKSSRSVRYFKAFAVAQCQSDPTNPNEDTLDTIKYIDKCFEAKAKKAAEEEGRRTERAKDDLKEIAVVTGKSGYELLAYLQYMVHEWHRLNER
jgi:hypothetical protein